MNEAELLIERVSALPGRYAGRLTAKALWSARHADGSDGRTQRPGLSPAPPRLPPAPGWQSGSGFAGGCFQGRQGEPAVMLPDDLP